MNLKVKQTGLDSTLKYFEEMKPGLKAKSKNIVSKAADYALRKAQSNAPSSIADTLYKQTYGNVKAIVASTADFATYIEFGTGVVGMGTPHPQPSSVEPNGWVYDVNAHGEAGWKYIGKDGKLHWTKGVPSKPFMYQATKDLENQLSSIAKEEFDK